MPHCAFRHHCTGERGKSIPRRGSSRKEVKRVFSSLDEALVHRNPMGQGVGGCPHSRRLVLDLALGNPHWPFLPAEVDQLCLVRFPLQHSVQFHVLFFASAHWRPFSFSTCASPRRSRCTSDTACAIFRRCNPVGTASSARGARARSSRSPSNVARPSSRGGPGAKAPASVRRGHNTARGLPAGTCGQAPPSRARGGSCDDGRRSFAIPALVPVEPLRVTPVTNPIL